MNHMDNVNWNFMRDIQSQARYDGEWIAGIWCPYDSPKKTRTIPESEKVNLSELGFFGSLFYLIVIGAVSYYCFRPAVLLVLILLGWWG